MGNLVDAVKGVDPNGVGGPRTQGGTTRAIAGCKSAGCDLVKTMASVAIEVVGVRVGFELSEPSPGSSVDHRTIFGADRLIAVKDDDAKIKDFIKGLAGSHGNGSLPAVAT